MLLRGLVVGAVWVASGAWAQGQRAVHLESLACGVGTARFTVKRYAADAPQNGGAKPRFAQVHEYPAAPALEPAPTSEARLYVLDEVALPPDVIGRLRMKLGMDGTWLGTMDGGFWMSFDIVPGTHHLCATDDATALMPLRAEAGKTYYVRYSTPGGVASLELLNEDQGAYLVKSSPRIVAVPKR